MFENVMQYPRWVTLFAAVCAVVFSIVGILGNFITVVALLRSTRLRRNATTAFVISLSVSDLIFASVNLPLTAIRYFYEAWILGDALCRVFPLFFYGNVAVSLLSMVAITINRYVLISRADIYPRIYTPRGICLMLIAIWTISFSLLIPPLLGVWGELGLDKSSFSCTILKKNNRSPKKLLFVVGFLLPCLVIIFSYLCIYWRVRESRRNIKAHTSQGAGPKRSGFVKREDSRVTWLMLTIFLCYLLCYMPLMLANCLEDQIKVPAVHVLASVLAWASAVINPFIYTGTNKLYREAYRQLLCPKKNKTTTMGSPVTNPKILHSHSSKMSSQPT